ncbi:MAG: Ni/Fe-hydrogenase, b-type cytochrome subunit [bacterium]
MSAPLRMKEQLHRHDFEEVDLHKNMAGSLIARKQWSVAMCINHWAMAVCIVILIVSGLYIGKPFTVAAGETWQKFSMADVRFVHLLFGFILTAILAWRAYLAFFSRFHADWKDFFAWLDFKNLYKQIKFYTLIDIELPEHTGLYGTLQSAAYGFLLIMVLGVVITGLILYGALHKAGLGGFISAVLYPVEGTMNGLAGVRFIHHVLTWGFVLFICVHTYLAFWYDIVFKKGTISSIISGRVFEKSHTH